MQHRFQTSIKEVFPSLVSPTWTPKMQHDYVDVGLFGVSINYTNLRYYLENTDKLIEVLKGCNDFYHRVLKGDFDHRAGYLKMYTVHTGIFHSDDRPPFSAAQRDKDYLTVMIRDIKPDGSISNESDCVNYIRVNKHDELVRDAQLDISDLVIQRVEKGVKEGIRSGMKEVTKTLSEIQHERAYLEDQLAALDKAEATASRVERSKPHQIRSKALNGYVYLLTALHDSTLFKIGRTNNPKVRGNTFGVKLPFKVEFDCIIKTDDMYALEDELHARFADQRLDGEWFRLSPDDIQYIKELST